MSAVFDARACSLGEGPLWHPKRRELFWFDINARRLHSAAQSWQFDLSVSAAGWISADALLIASEKGLHRFDVPAGTLGDPLVDIEADQPDTRSNDGRADPWGGFWIGTMGFHAEPHAGAIYRYYRGEVHKVARDITISNAICFDPQRRFANYTDTAARKIMRVDLDPPTGAPVGEARVWLDLTQTDLAPDGAVLDAQGNLWLACWGAGAVVVFDPHAREIARHHVAGVHTTCPAFGGADLSDLYVTSATEGLPAPLNDNGKTFVIKNAGRGQAEHQVIL